MNRIEFVIRWREELVATCNEGVLVFEISMGTLHVYFPDVNRWVAQVPSWATEKWEEYKTACEIWCRNNRIPITYISDALVYEEKR